MQLEIAYNFITTTDGYFRARRDPARWNTKQQILHYTDKLKRIHSSSVLYRRKNGSIVTGTGKDATCEGRPAERNESAIDRGMRVKYKPTHEHEATNHRHRTKRDVKSARMLTTPCRVMAKVVWLDARVAYVCGQQCQTR